jgi:two-component system, NtrC family, nitrogen regulation sensor histidine kinase NtrY
VGGALLTLLALVRWLRAEDGLSLVVAAAGLVTTMVSVRGLQRPRAFALAAMAALALALGVAVAETRALRALERAGEAWALAARNRDVARVAAGIEEAAQRAYAAARGAARTGIAVAPPVSGAESGLVVFEDGRPAARAGQSRVQLLPGREGVRLVRAPFYTAIVASSTAPETLGRGESGLRTELRRTAVATVLLTAAAPADRFARPLVPALVAPEVARSIRLDESLGYPLDPADLMRRAVRALPDTAEVLVVSSSPRSLEEARLAGLQRARVRTIVPLALAAVCLLIVGWRRPARLPERLLTVAALLTAIALTPFGALSNVSPLFNAANYFSPVGGPLTANIAAFTLTGLLALLALFRVLRSTRLAESRRLALGLVVGIAALGPFALRDLARGIAFPPSGPSVGLWIAWQLAIALAAAGILIAGASAGQVVLGRRRGLPAALGPLLAGVAALAAPPLWQPPGAWPAWYPVLWIAAIGALAFVRRGRTLVAAVAFVAGCGAVTLTWGATTRTRMQLAERDVPRLGATDMSAYPLLGRFTDELALALRAPDRAQLLERYAASDLAQAGYPAQLALWTGPFFETPIAAIGLASITDADGAQRGMARLVRESATPLIRAADDGPFTMLVAAVPFAGGTVVTIAVPPRTWLLPPDPFTRLTGIAATPDRAPPYRLSLGAPLVGVATSLPERLAWRRDGTVMSADATIGGEGLRRRAHVEVDLRGFDALAPRGALLVLLDVGIVLLVWGASAMADGGLWRWLRWQRARWRRSYRSRLSIALLAFFLAPAAAFALWEAYRLREDDRNARELLVREALRLLDVPNGAPGDEGVGLLTTPVLSLLADDVGGPLFAYRDGVLSQASDPLLAALAPFGTLLPADLPTGAISERQPLDASDAPVYARFVSLAARSGLVGFRPTVGPEGMPLVLATAARGDEFALDARRADLAVLVLLVSVSGVLAALWLSGAAARQLARPIGSLRDAALAIADGRPLPPLDAMPPAEFVPVFGAFAQMATDLSTSRAALEEAQRRTAAVLREVASGVVAIRHDGTVLLANPRAAELLGTTLAPGRAVLGAADGALPLVTSRVREFLDRPDRALADFDLTVPTDGRQLRASLTRLPGGAVLTLDDVTDLASAQRVLAWGEMARQIAHEIKNPLTPIRLGVQHLRRAWRDGRPDFGDILDTNVTRILAEIDHLDEIARAFSRYGSAPAERAPAEPIDVARVALDVVTLERMGEGEVTWTLEVPTVTGVPHTAEPVPPVFALARADEFREVVLNLLENARLADARHVRCTITVDGETVFVRVHDDGVGMAPEVMLQIFQPHFSTRTSGSGLGLAISRRLLEGWGGTITAESTPGVGSTFTIVLRHAPAPD